MIALALALCLQTAPKVSEERIVLRTTMGDLTLALYPEVAPKHVAQILRLVRLGVYDGLHFHRIEPGFVAQITDHNDRLAALTPEQKHAIQKIPGEFSSIPHTRGILSMARWDDPNSADVSFSIVLGREGAKHLDGQYTVFGHLESGHHVLDAIEKVRCDSRKRPLTRVGVKQTKVSTSAPISGRSLLFPGIVLMLGGLVSSFIIGHVLPRWTRSVAMAVLLIGGFLVLVAVAPMSQKSERWVPVVLFVGAVALFRFLATFEGPAPKKAGPPQSTPDGSSPGAPRLP